MLLADLLAHKRHRFWPSPAASKAVLYLRALGHQQVNDAYLVEVARRHRGRVVTLDSRMPMHADDKSLVAVIVA